MSIKDYCVPFFIGGTIVAGIKYLGNNVNTKLAAILGAAPIGLASSYFISSMINTKTYVRNYSNMVVVLFFSILSYRFFLYKGIGKNKGLLMAVGIWALLGIIIYFTPILKKKHTIGKF